MRQDLKRINALLKQKRKADKARKEIELWAVKKYRDGFDDALTLRRPLEKELVAGVKIEWPVLTLSSDDIAQKMIEDELAYKLGKKILEFTPIEKREDGDPMTPGMVYIAKVTVVQNERAKNA